MTPPNGNRLPAGPIVEHLEEWLRWHKTWDNPKLVRAASMSEKTLRELRAGRRQTILLDSADRLCHVTGESLSVLYPLDEEGAAPERKDVQEGGCPKTVWDGPYKMRCGLGGDGDVCARHGRFR